jgi:hypothetical protein
MDQILNSLNGKDKKYSLGNIEASSNFIDMIKNTRFYSETNQLNLIEKVINTLFKPDDDNSKQ